MALIKLFTVLLAFPVFGEVKQRINHIYWLEKIADCQHYGNLKIHVHNVTIVNYGLKQSTFNAIFTVKNVMPGTKVKLTTVLSKCATVEDNNCEHILTAKYDDVCLMVKDKRNSMAVVHGLFSPPVDCVWNHNGVYELKNASFPIDNLLTMLTTMIGFLDVHWKLLLKPYNKEIMGCFTITGQIKKLHRHRLQTEAT